MNLTSLQLPAKLEQWNWTAYIQPNWHSNSQPATSAAQTVVVTVAAAMKKQTAGACSQFFNWSRLAAQHSYNATLSRSEQSLIWSVGV
jgi:hypothetical protein